MRRSVRSRRALRRQLGLHFGAQSQTTSQCRSVVDLHGLDLLQRELRRTILAEQADELIETMNRAAEMAVVEAKPILTNAVKSMSFDDARGILTGGGQPGHSADDTCTDGSDMDFEVMYLLHGHDVSGWTTIVVSLMLFAGIQLLSLGVVAEYVGRIYEEVKGRPLYLVKRELGQGLDAASPAAQGVAPLPPG